MKDRILSAIEAVCFVLVVFGIIGGMMNFNTSSAWETFSLAAGLLVLIGVIALVHGLKVGNLGPLRRLREKATTPSRRVGFVLWCVGMPLTVYGGLVLAGWVSDIGEFLFYAGKGMSFDSHFASSPGGMLGLGLWFDLVGAVVWFYQSTIGRLFTWIRTGSA